MADVKKGEGWAWALGIFGLLGLAGPVFMFTDLPMICGVAATAPAQAGPSGLGEATILWLELAGLAGEDRPEKVWRAYEDRGLLKCGKKAVVADTLFLVFYGGLLSIAAMLVARGWRISGRPGAGKVYGVVAGVVLLAATLDLVENMGLLRMLDEPPRLEVAGRTAVCAAAKFGLLIGALGAIAVGGVPLLLRVRTGPPGIMALAGVAGVGAAGAMVALVVAVAGAWRGIGLL